MTNIAVVVVTYNRKQLLSECIVSLEKQSQKDFDIFVIDNASSDGTEDFVKTKWDLDNIYYYNTGKNLGGAGGFNFGLKKVLEKKYDYVWIMDDDTIPKENALESFLIENEKLNGQYGFFSGKVLWKDGSICYMNRQKKTKWKYLKEFDSMENIQYASFVSLFIPTWVIKEVGFPIKDFFIWTDDWEYTRRISRNYKCYFVPESEVVHWCDNNIGADIINAPDDRLERFSYMYRNDVYMYRQDGLEGWVYLFIRFLLHTFRILLKARNKKEKMKVMCESLKRGFSFNPEVEFVNQREEI